MLFSGLDDAIVLYPVYSLLFARHGLTAAEISSLLALWSGAAFLLEVPTGALADRVSRRGLLASGAFLRAVGFSLWVLVPSYPAFAVGLLLWAVKGALTSGTLQALVYDELATAGETGWYPRLVGRAAAVEGAAGLVATAAAAPVLAAGGYRLVGLLSVVACLCQVPVALSFPATTVRPGSESSAWRAYVDSLRDGVAEAARRPTVRRFVLTAGLVPGLAAFDEYVPLLAKDDGIAEPLIPLLLVVPGIAMVVAALLVGRQARQPIVAPLLVAGILVATGAWAGTIAGIAAVGIGIGACHLVRLRLDVRLQNAVQGPARATVTSLAGVLGEGGALGLITGYGIGSHWLELRWLFVLTAAALGCVAAAAARLRRRPPPA